MVSVIFLNYCFKLSINILFKVQLKVSLFVVTENLKDTVESELVKITFEPKLCTFEMDIMKANGIEENRDPQKFYWY